MDHPIAAVHRPAGNRQLRRVSHRSGLDRIGCIHTAGSAHAVHIYERDEAGQATYLSELLEIFETEGVDSAFVYLFALPGYPRRPDGDPKDDLDRASLGIVKLLEGRRGQTYPGMGTQGRLHRSGAPASEVTDSAAIAESAVDLTPTLCRRSLQPREPRRPIPPGRLFEAAIFIASPAPAPAEGEPTVSPVPSLLVFRAAKTRTQKSISAAAPIPRTRTEPDTIGSDTAVIN